MTSSPPPLRPLDGEPAVLGGPIFVGTGSARDVAVAYLRDRFPDYPEPGIVIGDEEVDGVRASVPWTTNDDSGVLGEGRVSLVRSDGGWTVVASDTAGVDVTGPRYVDGRLRAEFSSADDDALVARVLAPDGTLVAEVAPARGPIEIDVPAGKAPLLLRVNHVGGTVLSVSEYWVRPDTGPSRVVADGDWAGGSWSTHASETCVWIELDVGEVGRTCQPDAPAAGFAVFGPVARVEGETLYFGVVGTEVAVVRTTALDGSETSYSQPVEGLVVMPVPTIGRFEVAFLATDGAVLERMEVDPSGPIGG